MDTASLYHTEGWEEGPLYGSGNNWAFEKIKFQSFTVRAEASMIQRIQAILSWYFSV